VLSNRLIQLAEDHWERIAVAAMERIRRDSELSRMAKLPDFELRDWARDILKSLQSWPGPDKDKKFSKRYADLGRRRYEESVPFHEAVRALHILKRAIIDFVRNQGFGPTALEIYSEEELEDRVDLFFDRLLYHAARGYDAASGRVAGRGH
jgi:hypothetical protein